jgi:hypothetical protein
MTSGTVVALSGIRPRRLGAAQSDPQAALMCGRYSLTSTINQLLPRLKGPLPEGFLEHYQPRLQVRPGEPLLIQRQQQGRPEVG